MQDSSHWPSFDAPLVPSDRDLEFHPSIIAALDCWLLAERLRVASRPRRVPAPTKSALRSKRGGRFAAKQATIERAYMDWLADEASRQGLAISMLLDGVAARFKQSGAVARAAGMDEPLEETPRSEGSNA
jgi:hypothetical protein